MVKEILKLKLHVVAKMKTISFMIILINCEKCKKKIVSHDYKKTYTDKPLERNESL